MITVDQDKRISADEALEHPWIKKLGVSETVNPINND